MTRPGQKASKRVPLARRYAIKKKAKEAERKARRDAKKNPALRKKLRKDLGIPNLNPFKAQILKRLEEQEKLIRFNETQHQRRQQEFAQRRRMGSGNELAGLAADAASRSATFSTAGADAAVMVQPNSRAGESTRRAFYRHVKALLEKADVLLEVLDARDPLSCRAPAVEALALAMDPPKRIVLVLNKIDLVPPEVVQMWLTYLRREFPTVAFKASTQQQRAHLSAPGGGALNKATEAGEVLTGAGAAGADTLMQLLKNYSRSHNMKTAVTVGVVGYPNVGKSSVINSLKRNKAVGVSSMPGFTRTLQEVSIDSKVTLIDCPGVIFDDDVTSVGDSSDDGGAGLLLRNCISVDAVEDPEAAVHGILQRCAPEKLMSLYAIPAFTSTGEFLAAIATKRGKLSKGGVPDKGTAAKCVLQDWNGGKIPFFVLPPGEESAAGGMEEDAATTPASASTGSRAGAGAASDSVMKSYDDVGSSAVVAEWSKEFDMESILKAEAEMLASIGTATGPSLASVAAVRSAPGVRATSSAARAAAARLMAEAEEDDEEDDEDYDEDEDMEGDEDDDEDDEDEEEDEEDDDDDDDDEDMEDDEEEAAAPARKGGKVAPAAGKNVRFSGVPAPAAVKGGKGGKAAPAAAAGSGAGGSYNFGKWFKK